MKVSIIIPVHNAEKYISNTLNSVINQTYKDIEIVCVDDGSGDNSLNILQRFQKKDKRIVVINQKNKGVSAARNLGLQKAQGEAIAFVDGDDLLPE